MGPRNYDCSMYEGPVGLVFNRGAVEDPATFATESGAASWLLLTGEEFAAGGGLSLAQVQAVVPDVVNVISDPPRELTMDLARRQVAALDTMPRPTVVTCRMGPRSSALAYLWSGLRQGATADDVLARADADEAPFAGDEELRGWVTLGLAELT
jgi:hypothetical protein